MAVRNAAGKVICPLLVMVDVAYVFMVRNIPYVILFVNVLRWNQYRDRTYELQFSPVITDAGVYGEFYREVRIDCFHGGFKYVRHFFGILLGTFDKD